MEQHYLHASTAEGEAFTAWQAEQVVDLTDPPKEPERRFPVKRIAAGASLVALVGALVFTSVQMHSKGNALASTRRTLSATKADLNARELELIVARGSVDRLSAVVEACRQGSAQAQTAFDRAEETVRAVLNEDYTIGISAAREYRRAADAALLQFETCGNVGDLA